VIAILGVLAAVVIPNVGRFMGAGKGEASETELADVQLAVTAMMVDNNLSALPHPVLVGSATANMSAFPDPTSACTTPGEKVTDPDGIAYQAGDKDGFVLFDHDIIADGSPTTGLVRYLANATTKGTYYVDSDGTVYQKTTGYE
jgi:type II secretory pathway pseudopilin PulG